jgi:hypothetical protein
VNDYAMVAGYIVAACVTCYDLVYYSALQYMMMRSISKIVVGGHCWVVSFVFLVSVLLCVIVAVVGCCGVVCVFGQVF